MNNRQLDEILRTAKVPDPAQKYWDEFPGDVTRISRSSGFATLASQSPISSHRRAWWPSAIAFATVCIIAAFVIGYKLGNKSQTADQSLANVQKCLREVQSMFPNQVEAIIFEKDGPKLLLSDAPNVSGAMPVYLKICDGNSCERIVTFSGQRVPIKGELCDVLVDSKENVLVIGEREFWPGGMPSRTRVDAKAL